MGRRREVIVLCRFSACFLRVFCVFSACFLRVFCVFSACFLRVFCVSFPWSLSYLWVCSELVRVCSECVLSCIDHVAVISSVGKWAEWKISKKFRRLKDEESSLRLQAHHDQTIRMIFGWRRLLSPEQTTEPIHNMQVRHWNQTMIPSSGQTFDDDELIFEYFSSSFFLGWTHGRMDKRVDLMMMLSSPALPASPVHFN